MKPVLILTDEQEVDRFGELSRMVAAFAPTKAEYEVVAKSLRSRFVAHAPDAAYVAEGSLYRVLVSERAEERSFSLKARMDIFKRMGKAKACAAFGVTLRAVAKALGEPVVDELATAERTGTRTLVAVLKEEVVPALKAA